MQKKFSKKIGVLLLTVIITFASSNIYAFNEIVREKDAAGNVNIASTKVKEEEKDLIKDDVLRSVIKNELDLNENDILTQEELDTLNFLKYDGLNKEKKIKSLEGILNASNLKILDLPNNEITKIPELPGQICEIYLQNNKIEKIEIQGDNPIWFKVDLSNNKIKDLDWFEDVYGIGYLDLQRNNIQDITPISRNIDILTRKNKDNRADDFHIDISEQDISIDSKKKNDIISLLLKESLKSFHPWAGGFIWIDEIRNISDNGEYDKSKGTIEWENPKGSSVSFDFEKEIALITGVVLFNGKVTLPLDSSNNGGGTGNTEPPSTSKTVILASGEKYTDVLTATVLGNEKDAPILLSHKDKVEEETLEEIKRLNTYEIIISGGTDSISEKVVSQLADYKVTRIAGNDRYETATKIGNEVRKITGNKTGAVLVDGTNFPDVITMSTLASQKRVPILLTEPNELNNITKDTIKSWELNDITIGGSYNSVSKNIEDNLSLSQVGRLGGLDRYETAELVATEVRKIGSKDDMILVDGTNFPDGITVNSLASKFKTPIMLTQPNVLSNITADKITEWSIKNVLIAGGENSVSKNIEDKLTVSKKERISGKDRYDTAVEISKRVSSSNRNIVRK